MKGKATNEQLAKVLEYTLSEHQKNIEKSEKERTVFINEFKNQIESLKNISLKPNLTEFEHLNERLEKGCVNGAEQIKSALKSTYFSPLVLGIVFTVFISLVKVERSTFILLIPIVVVSSKMIFSSFSIFLGCSRS